MLAIDGVSSYVEADGTTYEELGCTRVTAGRGGYIGLNRNLVSPLRWDWEPQLVRYYNRPRVPAAPAEPGKPPAGNWYDRSFGSRIAHSCRDVPRWHQPAGQSDADDSCPEVEEEKEEDDDEREEDEGDEDDEEPGPQQPASAPPVGQLAAHSEPQIVQFYGKMMAELAARSPRAHVEAVGELLRSADTSVPVAARAARQDLVEANRLWSRRQPGAAEAAARLDGRVALLRAGATGVAVRRPSTAPNSNLRLFIWCLLVYGKFTVFWWVSGAAFAGRRRAGCVGRGRGGDCGAGAAAAASAAGWERRSDGAADGPDRRGAAGQHTQDNPGQSTHTQDNPHRTIHTHTRQSTHTQDNPHTGQSTHTQDNPHTHRTIYTHTGQSTHRTIHPLQPLCAMGTHRV